VSSDTLPKISEKTSQDQHAYAETWKKARPTLTILFEPTVKGAKEMARYMGKTHDDMQTIITSSEHLVGGALSLLQRS
jgi:folylpolyglutamate synthase